MAETSLPVRHLYTVTFEIGDSSITVGDGPQGTRMMVGVTGGHFEGDRLKGTVVEPGGDWVTRRADGSLKIDVRVILKTDDGAHILVTYNGIGTVENGGLTTRCAPLFETGDERYTWLNRIQAVGLGHLDGTHVVYEIYELL